MNRSLLCYFKDLFAEGRASHRPVITLLTFAGVFILQSLGQILDKEPLEEAGFKIGRE